MSKKTIFLSGMPRSMSTLMANILANNPRIGGGETSPLLEYVYGAKGNFSTTPEVKSALTEEIMSESFLNFCRSGINGYAEKITPKEIYLDKSRGWIHYAHFLWQIIPDAKIIVMVRDIRGIASSFEKKWRENPDVIDHRDNPAEQNFITVDQRVQRWLDDAPIGLSIRRLWNAWQTKTLNNNNILIVRAEELCKNPKAMMQKVYDFIEEPYYDLDYNDVKQMTVENDRIADFGIYGSHTIRQKIEPIKKDWDDILTTQVSNNIKAGYKWFYDEFNYF
ncbi:MAG TPA: sulfotransferase [Bacteroidia bacterium]|jgi:sulfotransferase|nr:sulfotransferase [Bacteroidia bacterium]